MMVKRHESSEDRKERKFEEDVSIDAIQKVLFAAPEDEIISDKAPDFDVQQDVLQRMLARLPEDSVHPANGNMHNTLFGQPHNTIKKPAPVNAASGMVSFLPSTSGFPSSNAVQSFPSGMVNMSGHLLNLQQQRQHQEVQKMSFADFKEQKESDVRLGPQKDSDSTKTNTHLQPMQVAGFVSALGTDGEEDSKEDAKAVRQVSPEEQQLMEQVLAKQYEEKRVKVKQMIAETAPFESADVPSSSNRRKRKRKPGLEPGTGAKAFRYPANKPFPIGLERPLLDLMAPGGPELDSLKLQKLRDATTLLQESNQHVLEPLTLYKKKELFELMASIAEAWKNSGKAAWKKRINKIKENARYRKAPRNGLDEKEIKEIEELQAKIQEREAWEKREKLKIMLAKGIAKTGSDRESIASSSTKSVTTSHSDAAGRRSSFSTGTPNLRPYSSSQPSSSSSSSSSLATHDH